MQNVVCKGKINSCPYMVSRRRGYAKKVCGQLWKRRRGKTRQMSTREHWQLTGVDGHIAAHKLCDAICFILRYIVWLNNPFANCPVDVASRIVCMNNNSDAAATSIYFNWEIKVLLEGRYSQLMSFVTFAHLWPHLANFFGWGIHSGFPFSRGFYP